jgi:hypothetical protein
MQGRHESHPELEDTMKIKDLMETLQKLDPEMQVVEADYWQDVHLGYLDASIEEVQIVDPKGKPVASPVTKYWDDEDKAKFGPVVKALRIGRG